MADSLNNKKVDTNINEYHSIRPDGMMSLTSNLVGGSCLSIGSVVSMRHFFFHQGGRSLIKLKLGAIFTLGFGYLGYTQMSIAIRQIQNKMATSTKPDKREQTLQLEAASPASILANFTVSCGCAFTGLILIPWVYQPELKYRKEFLLCSLMWSGLFVLFYCQFLTGMDSFASVKNSVKNILMNRFQ